MNAPTSRQSAESRRLLAIRSILLAVDSSDHSTRASSEAAAIASLFSARVTGIHVYAAKLHDLRFRQMEGGLPERYRQEEELERQRDVHDDLITSGLSMISDAHLDEVASRCRDTDVPFARRVPEGKNYREIVREVRTGAYDLLVLGALGLGATPSGRLGTVCRRVTRRAEVDTLVVKEPSRSISGGPIVVAIDGSEKSYGGLLTSLALANRFNVAVKVVAAFDPYFHCVAFKRLAGVLSAEGKEMFRLQEQEQLHEDIIDSGLAKIYQGHLTVAEAVARDHGVEIETELLSGKPHDAITKYVKDVSASLLVVGRLGVHADPELEIGGNTEQLLHDVDCAVWLSHREYRPATTLVASVTTTWTEEAERRMDRIPSFVQKMARMAILRYAEDQGHTVITERIVEEATSKLMPGHGHRAAGAESRNAAGHGAGAANSALPWSDEAAALLSNVPDKAVRNNLKLRVEKKARVSHCEVVRAEHVEAFVDGTQSEPAPSEEAESGCRPNTEHARRGTDDLEWTEEARERLQRVPDGFMRDLTRQRVEVFARGEGLAIVTIDLVAEKYSMWGESSAGQEPDLAWDEDAWRRIQRIPETVRGMVMMEVERRARTLGESRVSEEIVDAAGAAWRQGGAFHTTISPAEDP